MRCDAQRADQLRWVASQEWGGGEKEGVSTGKGCSPAGHLLGCRNFAWQWTKFCGKYSQCFCCFCNTKVSLVFVFFSNCYFTFEICSALGRYRLQKLYRIFMAVVAVSLLQGAWHLSTILAKRRKQEWEENQEQQKERRPRPRPEPNQNRKPNRHELCERLRYFRFGHLPDYFVLCLRIGAGSDQWLMPKWEGARLWVGQAEQ